MTSREYLNSQRKIKKIMLFSKIPKAIKTVVITECSKLLGLRLSLKNVWSHCSTRISTYVRVSCKQGNHLFLSLKIAPVENLIKVVETG